MKLKIWLWNIWVMSEEVLTKYMKSVVIMSAYVISTHDAQCIPMQKLPSYMYFNNKYR